MTGKEKLDWAIKIGVKHQAVEKKLGKFIGFLCDYGMNDVYDFIAFKSEDERSGYARGHNNESIIFYETEMDIDGNCSEEELKQIEEQLDKALKE